MSLILTAGSRLRGWVPPSGSSYTLLSSLGLSNGDDLNVTSGMRVIQDMNYSPSLGIVSVEGTGIFEFIDNTELITNTFRTSGDGWEIRGGMPGQYQTTPLENCFVTLIGDPAIPNDGDSRGWETNGAGWVKIRGRSPSVVWTKLNAHAAVDDETLTLKDSVDWRAGDRIAVGPTDYIEIGRSETFTLASNASGTSIALTTPVLRNKWGVLQYLTDDPDTPIQLTQETVTVPIAGFPTILDQRAPVGNLSRGFTVRCPNDANYAAGFGFQIGFHFGTKFIIDGWCLERGGQAGATGRYPIHTHFLSWDILTGDFVAALDPDEAQIINCVVVDSQQRAIVVHGTNGQRIARNVLFNNRCHNIFLEDAIEQYHEIDDNLVLGVRGAMSGLHLKNHEISQMGDFSNNQEHGPAAIWIPNPKNYVRGNHVADSEGAGIHWAIPADQDGNPVGLSASLGITGKARYARLLEVSNNTVHSCFGALALFRGGQSNEDGDIDIQYRYNPLTDDGLGAGPFYRIVTDIVGMNLFKGTNGAYRNAFHHPHYWKWVVGDSYWYTHMGQIDDFDGQGVQDPTTLRDSIDSSWIYGYSLNNENTNRPTLPGDSDSTNIKAGPVSYHFSVEFNNNWFVNFPEYVGTTDGGVANQPVGSNDFYTEPVELGHLFNTGNKFSACSSWIRALAPNIVPASTVPTTRAGAILTPKTWLGFPGEETLVYWVFNKAFLTYGGAGASGTLTGDGVPLALNDPTYSWWDNGRMISDHFHGMRIEATDFNLVQNPSHTRYYYLEHMLVERLSDVDWSVIDTWEQLEGTFGGSLHHFRHWVMRNGGRYRWKTPDAPYPTTYLYAYLVNMYRVGDNSIVGFDFDCSAGISASYCYHQGTATGGTDGVNKRVLTSAASRAAVEAGGGDLYWQDTTNDILWIKFVGGLSPLGGIVDYTIQWERRYHSLEIVKV